MADKIKIGIVGYGNLGQGVEKAVRRCSDIELCAVLTRRNPNELSIESEAVKLHTDDMLTLKGKIDVLLLCGGSATDLPVQGPEFAKHFNTVDSFDTHAKIPEYFDKIDDVSRRAGTTSLISTGWDPGLFSMYRVLAKSVLPSGDGTTFWGKGVSQGHSDAIRRIDGVAHAIQYTIPIEAAVQKARAGDGKLLRTRDKHLRECFVVAKEGADKLLIEKNIKTMPNYFADYETTVHFIDKEEFVRNHSAMPHGGTVIHSGVTGGEPVGEHKQTMEFSLNLQSNAEFTSSVLVAFARSVYRFHKEGRIGALTVLDIPITYLSPEDDAILRKDFL